MAGQRRRRDEGDGRLLPEIAALIALSLAQALVARLHLECDAVTAKGPLTPCAHSGGAHRGKGRVAA